MEEFSQYFSFSPIDLHETNSRINSINQLKDNIISTEKVFMEYSQVGQKLCDCMDKLANSFVVFTQNKKDPTINSISGILSSFRSTFFDHYSQIEEQIVSPLRDFISHEISDVEIFSKTAQTTAANYLTNLEKFSNTTTKRKASEGSDVIPKLIKSHSDAIQAKFNLERTLELIERKKMIELTGKFLAFINVAAVTYRECVFNFDELKDSFIALQAALPVSAEIIRTFSDHTKNRSMTLDSSVALYWNRLTDPFPGTTSLSHEGILWRKGAGFAKTWGRRYFICKDRTLFCYRDDSNEPVDSMPLLLCTVKSITDSDRSHCFSVISSSEKMILQAMTEYDKDEWMAVIANNIQYALNHSGEQSSPTVTAEQINATCADCGAPHPTWCCINWGVCICIHCSGAHRALGTTHSKVRSLTLDRLDKETLKIFDDIGNDKANSILEANVGDAKIKETATKEQRMNFIRRKYVDKEWMSAPKVTDLEKAIKDHDVMSVFSAVCQNQINERSLFIAASVGTASICQLIAQNLKTINVLDEAGWSAFSYAAYYGNIVTAELLLSQGLDPNASKDGHPYAIAKSRGFSSIVMLFMPYWNGDEVQNVCYTPLIKLE